MKKHLNLRKMSAAARGGVQLYQEEELLKEELLKEELLKEELLEELKEEELKEELREKVERRDR